MVALLLCVTVFAALGACGVCLFCVRWVWFC